MDNFERNNKRISSDEGSEPLSGASATMRSRPGNVDSNRPPMAGALFRSTAPAPKMRFYVSGVLRQNIDDVLKHLPFRRGNAGNHRQIYR